MQPLEVSNYADLEKLILSSDNMGFALPAQQSMIISCPKKMVGRVIGKNGETIKALQQFTGAQIQIDQRSDPTRVSIAGAPKAMQMATSMVQDIVAGTFKGFAMLRSYATQATKAPGALEPLGQPAPVYIEGYGFIPPSQFSDVSEGPFAYPQLQPYMSSQVPTQASLSALSQLYSLPSQPEYNMGMATVPQHFNGMNSMNGGINGVEQNSQQVHMASLARSLLESRDLKLPNGVHHSHGALPTSQPDLSSGGRATGPQDAPNLAAQLQALSLLSNYQDQQQRVATPEGAQPPPSSKAAPALTNEKLPQPQPPLPNGWMHITDPEKRELYYNYLTGHTQYTLPTSTQPQAVNKASLLETGNPIVDITANGVPSPPGQHVSAPLGLKLHNNDTIGSLGHCLSVPSTLSEGSPPGSLLSGTLPSQHSGMSDPRAPLTQKHTGSLDAALRGLGQRMPDSHDFKLGLFQ